MAIPAGFNKLATIGLRWVEYNPNGTYTLLNCTYVPEEGRSYVALKDSPSLPPSHDNINWSLISDRGRDGAGGVTEIIIDGQSYRGSVELAAHTFGLENLVHESPESILAHLTIREIEFLLGIENVADEIHARLTRAEYIEHMRLLQDVLDSKADDNNVVHGIRFEVGEELSDLNQDEVVISARNLGLDKVENVSPEELVDKVRDEVVPDDIGAVPTVESDHLIVYGADGSGNRTMDAADHDTISDLYLQIQDAVYNEEEEKIPDILSDHADDVPTLGALLDFLRNEHEAWTLHHVLTDLHPVLGIKYGDGFYKSGYVDITDVINEGLKLESTVYYAHCDTAGDVPIKKIAFDEGLELRDGVLIYVSFEETHTASVLYFDVNELGEYPVRIGNQTVDRTTRKTFQKDGCYVFMFSDDSWNFVTGTNDVVRAMEITITPEEWKGESAPYSCFFPVDEKYQDYNISFETSLDVSEEITSEYDRIGLSGRQIFNGILLQTELKPTMDLPAVLKFFI